MIKIVLLLLVSSLGAWEVLPHDRDDDGTNDAIFIDHEDQPHFVLASPGHHGLYLIAPGHTLFSDTIKMRHDNETWIVNADTVTKKSIRIYLDLEEIEASEQTYIVFEIPTEDGMKYYGFDTEGITKAIQEGLEQYIK